MYTVVILGLFASVLICLLYRSMKRSDSVDDQVCEAVTVTPIQKHKAAYLSGRSILPTTQRCRHLSTLEDIREAPSHSFLLVDLHVQRNKNHELRNRRDGIIRLNLRNSGSVLLFVVDRVYWQ